MKKKSLRKNSKFHGASVIRIVTLKKIIVPHGLPFEKATRRVLGDRYDLEIIFINSQGMSHLNTTYRNKSTTTNVLSFSLDETHGQIFFDPAVIRKEARELNTSFKKRLWFLFLHGILHLDGMDHMKKNDAVKMQRAELLLLKAFPA